MTRDEAIAYVRSCAESEGPETYEEAAEVFRALYDRAPVDDDGDQGQIWSLCCAAVERHTNFTEEKPMQTDSTDYSPKPPVPAQIVDMTAAESAALERLRVTGNGNPIGATLPEDDAYAVVLFGWGPDDTIPYGSVHVSPEGRHYMPIDHGTALALRDPQIASKGDR